MLQEIIRRLEELQVSQEYSSKIITMLAYYLEGKYSGLAIDCFSNQPFAEQRMSCTFYLFY